MTVTLLLMPQVGKPLELVKCIFIDYDLQVIQSLNDVLNVILF